LHQRRESRLLGVWPLIAQSPECEVPSHKRWFTRVGRLDPKYTFLRGQALL
jgi:hypothetical protein